MVSKINHYVKFPLTVLILPSAADSGPVLVNVGALVAVGPIGPLPNVLCRIPQRPCTLLLYHGGRMHQRCCNQVRQAYATPGPSLLSVDARVQSDRLSVRRAASALWRQSKRLPGLPSRRRAFRRAHDCCRQTGAPIEPRFASGVSTRNLGESRSVDPSPRHISGFQPY